jgi:hypothetical protein
MLYQLSYAHRVSWFGWAAPDLPHLLFDFQSLLSLFRRARQESNLRPAA